MSVTDATSHTRVTASASRSVRKGNAPGRQPGLLAGAWPIALPCALLVAGAGVGYAFSLDQPVALERLFGLAAASAVAIFACLWLRRLSNPHAVLLAAAILALVGGGWVIAATGADVFRGSLGVILDKLFGPLFGVVRLTDDVSVTNTRFIVGYNGLIDLCLVAIFCTGAVLLDRPGRVLVAVCAAVMAIGLLLLIGAGARGGVTGLAVGICVVALVLWPRRYGIVALVAVPAALVVASASVLDKGLEFSSTAGRLTYWADLARLLVEYPLTGVGLGVDTANRVALQYEINPDPERVFYAHNTFVQTYLEQGPLGVLGMLLIVGVAVGVAVLARHEGFAPGRRALLVAGLGVVGGLEAHGLTDQVVTTNVGTLLLLLGLAAACAALTDASLARLRRWSVVASVGVIGAVLVAFAALLVLPSGRAQLLLDFGGLKLNHALALPPQAPERARALADAEAVLTAALAEDQTHPAVLRDLAWVRSARFDDTGGLKVLQQAADSPRIDAFDLLQIAHVYRDLGVTDVAYALAARSYAATGRSLEDAVMGTYAQATLSDARARTLADQAEAAMRARHFGDAHGLFEQAATFEPSNQYLQDRIGAAQRAVDKYGP
jgi:O-Antigen ligase